MKPQASTSAAPESFIRCNSQGSSRAVLLLGTGDHAYRGYALAALAAARRVVVIDRAAPTRQQRRHIADHAVADLRDLPAMKKAAQALAVRHHVRGVLSWDEYSVVAAAEIARSLGMPGPDPEAVQAARDKGLARARLDAGRVPGAAWERVRSREAARWAASGIGYPVILKPAAAGGSSGVVAVHTPGELDSAWAFTAAAAARHGGDVLVEELLDGPEVSVEIISHRGQHHPVALTAKRLGEPPYCEEVGHVVDGHAVHTPDGQEAARVAVAALQALGISTGAAHVELRRTGDGWRIIEVNARLGGDLIPYLVQLATGVDLVAAAAAVACGETPDVRELYRRCAGIRFLYPATTGHLQRVTVDPGLDGCGWAEPPVITQPVGAWVSPPPAGDLESRIGHVIVTARYPDQCRARLGLAARGVRADIVPAPDGVPTSGAHS